MFFFSSGADTGDGNLASRAVDEPVLTDELHEKGFVYNAYFRDCMGDQFYAICNCCTCCCTGINTQKHLASIAFGRPVNKLLSSGYAPVIDQEGKCLACGTCARHCPFDAMSLVEKNVVIHAGRCMGCGVCVSQCPQNAISIQENPDAGLPLDVQKLTGHP